MHLLWLLCACAAHGVLFAQSAPADSTAPPAMQSPLAQPPEPTDTATSSKSPADLYKQAMHPLDVVRGSLDNWSDAELGALAVGMHMANEDCAQTKPELYKGDDLFNLARLCAFGQDWEGANDAALAYIAQREEEHRTQSYAISVSSLFHMRAVDLAVETARGMLKFPYDAEVAYALRDLKNNLVQASDPAALSLAEAEHPLIVAALKQGVPLKAEHGDAVIGLGALYESAMQLAFLDRYAGKDDAAAVAAADVQAALPATATLAAEDQLRIDATARRYQLLGTHLPDVKILRALQSPAAKAQVDLNFASATVLVLFPDWCVECRKMMKTLTKFAEVNRDTPIHAYGLVFADDSVVLGAPAHEQNLEQLAGTRTLVVPATAVQALGATDYPLGIVLDDTRTIRFVGTLPADAFSGDGYVSKLIVNMVKIAHNPPQLTKKGN
ncbi:MAG TPA: hypothetical protein VFB43_14525 [Terracidiphilus sp.]|nr:hypothetical protein [Terracidiphilus sp.]